MPRPPAPLVLLALTAAVGGAGWWWLHRGPDPAALGVLRISGAIEATTAVVGFGVGGRVAHRTANEGAKVKAGDLLAELDSRQLADERAARAADVQAVKAALADLEAGSRPEERAQANAVARQARSALSELQAGSRRKEIEAGRAGATRARAQAAEVTTRAARLEALFAEGGVSAQERDAVQAAALGARATAWEAQARVRLLEQGARPEQLDQARAAVSRAEAGAALVRAGARPQQLAQARARVAQAQAALAIASSRLADARVLAPMDGVVLAQHVEPGEVVAAGAPAVTLADLSAVYLRGYVAETDLGRVQLGQLATLTTDTWPGKTYAGRVTFLASQAEFTPRAVQTEKERVKLVYRVKINVPNPDRELKPGMPADATIRLR